MACICVEKKSLLCPVHFPKPVKSPPQPIRHVRRPSKVIEPKLPPIILEEKKDKISINHDDSDADDIVTHPPTPIVENESPKDDDRRLDNISFDDSLFESSRKYEE